MLKTMPIETRVRVALTGPFGLLGIGMLLAIMVGVLVQHALR